MRGGVDRIARHYEKALLWLIAAMMLAALLAMQIVQDTSLVAPLAATVVFSLLCGVAYARAWKAVAQRAQGQLAKFYIAASALRMMAALATVFVGAVLLRPDSQRILGFVAIFGGFYAIILAFDCIYFARVEKRNKINEK